MPPPYYRLSPPGEIVEAERIVREGAFVVLRGTTLVIGKPREIVIRRVPARVTVEELASPAGPLTGPPLV